MTNIGREDLLLEGDGAGDEHLPDLTHIPFWKRAVEWARGINAEATQNQKAKALALGMGSVLVRAAVGREIVSHHN